jgi:hypothetical protein
MVAVKSHRFSVACWASTAALGLSWTAQARAQSTAGADALAPPAPAPLVLVHIDAPAPVDLEASHPDGTWVTVCSSPCDRGVPSDGAYRIRGAGIAMSSTFRLQAGDLRAGERLTMRVDPSSGGRAGGVVLTVVGVVGLAPIAGVTALIAVGEIAGAILICPIASAFETVKSQQGAEYGSCLGGIGAFFAQGYVQPWVWIPAIAGGALTAGGVVWLATTRSGTAVTQTTASAAMPPAFQSPLAFEAVRFPRAVTYPLVEVHF